MYLYKFISVFLFTDFNNLLNFNCAKLQKNLIIKKINKGRFNLFPK